MTEIDYRKPLLEYLDEDTAYELAENVPAGVLNKPVRRLNTRELCYLLRCNAALPVLAPMALEKLATDPFIEAGDYPGDLLVALMESDSRFWLEERELWEECVGVLAEAIETINTRAREEELGEYMPWYLGDDFMGALMHFRGLHA